MIEIFGKKECPYCDQVTNALNNMGIDYSYLDVEEDEVALSYMRYKGLRTVPQLFYNDKHYGGSESLVDLINDMEDSYE